MINIRRLLLLASQQRREARPGYRRCIVATECNTALRCWHRFLESTLWASPAVDIAVQLDGLPVAARVFTRPGITHDRTCATHDLAGCHKPPTICCNRPPA